MGLTVWAWYKCLFHYWDFLRLILLAWLRAMIFHWLLKKFICLFPSPCTNTIYYYNVSGLESKSFYVEAYNTVLAWELDDWCTLFSITFNTCSKAYDSVILLCPWPLGVSILFLKCFPLKKYHVSIFTSVDIMQIHVQVKSHHIISLVMCVPFLFLFFSNPLITHECNYFFILFLKVKTILILIFLTCCLLTAQISRYLKPLGITLKICMYVI